MFMKILMKSLVQLCAVTLLVAATATKSSGQATSSTPARPVIKANDLFTNTIVAKANGITITRSQLDEALIGIKSGAAARGTAIPPEQMTMLERQILQRIIQVQLLVAKATDADKATGKEQTQKRLTEIKARAGSEELFDKQLKSLGMTTNDLAAKMTEELTADTVLRRELKVSVTDDQVKKFYDENPARFEEPEMVRAAHVLIGTMDMATRSELSAEQKAAKKKIADDVLKKARAGEDFAKLAKEYSEDPGSKDKGGEYTFPRGQMVPEFEAAAFSLNTNQVSDIVTTQFGYHIIKLYEKLPAKKVEFDKVKDDIKEYLTRQDMEKLVPAYMEKLEKDGNVQILDERLKPADLPMAPPSTGPGPGVAPRPGSK
jgi:peptidyl-prolyl cis-trans isomerase C